MPNKKKEKRKHYCLNYKKYLLTSITTYLTYLLNKKFKKVQE